MTSEKRHKPVVSRTVSSLKHLESGVVDFASDPHIKRIGRFVGADPVGVFGVHASGTAYSSMLAAHLLVSGIDAISEPLYFGDGKLYNLHKSDPAVDGRKVLVVDESITLDNIHQLAAAKMRSFTEDPDFDYRGFGFITTFPFRIYGLEEIERDLEREASESEHVAYGFEDPGVNEFISREGQGARRMAGEYGACVIEGADSAFYSMGLRAYLLGEGVDTRYVEGGSLRVDDHVRGRVVFMVGDEVEGLGESLRELGARDFVQLPLSR